jgi:anti-sigma factor ChrR (cupin superfamily)
MSGSKNQAPWFIDEATDQHLTALDLAMPAGEAPAGLWARIAGDLGREAADVRVDEGSWREYAPGVTYKRLWGRRTVLLRCSPGAWVPEHEHRSFEHTVVISGDLVIDDRSYGPGDYLGTPAGETHPNWTTRAGCVVLVHYEAA